MTEPEDEPLDPDREAILARRKHFVARALPQLDRAPLAGPRTKVMALAVSSLATACPCLEVYVPPPSSEANSGETGEWGTSTEDTAETSDEGTATDEGTDTGTGTA